LDGCTKAGSSALAHLANTAWALALQSGPSYADACCLQGLAAGCMSARAEAVGEGGEGTGAGPRAETHLGSLKPTLPVRHGVHTLAALHVQSAAWGPARTQLRHS
jgi:hypothetical protein